MKFIFSCLLCFAIFSCENSANNSNTTATISTNKIEPTHNSTGTFSIKGMTCEIGCVRIVKSRLSKMTGVIEIEMNFDTARTINFSTVKFDNKFVTEAEMKTEIESIANGIYAVTNVKLHEN